MALGGDGAKKLFAGWSRSGQHNEANVISFGRSAAPDVDACGCALSGRLALVGPELYSHSAAGQDGCERITRIATAGRSEWTARRAASSEQPAASSQHTNAMGPVEFNGGQCVLHAPAGRSCAHSIAAFDRRHRRASAPLATHKSASIKSGSRKRESARRHCEAGAANATGAGAPSMCVVAECATLRPDITIAAHTPKANSVRSKPTSRLAARATFGRFVCAANWADWLPHSTSGIGRAGATSTTIRAAKTHTGETSSTLASVHQLNVKNLSPGCADAPPELEEEDAAGQQ